MCDSFLIVSKKSRLFLVTQSPRYCAFVSSVVFISFGIYVLNSDTMHKCHYIVLYFYEIIKHVTTVRMLIKQIFMIPTFETLIADKCIE